MSPACYKYPSLSDRPQLAHFSQTRQLFPYTHVRSELDSWFCRLSHGHHIQEDFNDGNDSCKCRAITDSRLGLIVADHHPTQIQGRPQRPSLCTQITHHRAADLHRPGRVGTSASMRHRFINHPTLGRRPRSFLEISVQCDRYPPPVWHSLYAQGSP